MESNIRLKGQFVSSEAGLRVDVVMASRYPEYSRSLWAKWIESGQVLLDGGRVTKKTRIQGTESYQVDVVHQAQGDWQAQAIDISIVYQDEDLIVINKPINLVVHPGAGNPDNTLVNAILHHFPHCANLPRAGIVHRLDKDTSGLMLVAHSLRAHQNLVQAISERRIRREYDAIVSGCMITGKTIDVPIGRDPKNRLRMAVVATGKPAVTHLRVIEKYAQHTLLRCRLETGRTHQIRVHCQHAGFPIVGDKLYGQRVRLPKAANSELIDCLTGFSRQALHAASLALNHPATGEALTFTADVPDDMQQLQTLLRLQGLR